MTVFRAPLGANDQRFGVTMLPLRTPRHVARWGLRSRPMTPLSLCFHTSNFTVKINLSVVPEQVQVCRIRSMRLRRGLINLSRFNIQEV